MQGTGVGLRLHRVVRKGLEEMASVIKNLKEMRKRNLEVSERKAFQAEGRA